MSWTHILVWRAGRPTVITLHPDGRHEIRQRAFDDEHAAIAHLLRLVNAPRIARLGRQAAGTRRCHGGEYAARRGSGRYPDLA